MFLVSPVPWVGGWSRSEKTWHALGQRIKLEPQQWPELQKWQHLILNLLRLTGTPILIFFKSHTSPYACLQTLCYMRKQTNSTGSLICIYIYIYLSAIPSPTCGFRAADLIIVSHRANKAINIFYRFLCRKTKTSKILLFFLFG